LTAEERNALREERFQRMRERFMQQRREMMERWDSYWKTLDEMTPEQKEAMEAVFGHGRGHCAQRAMGRKMPPGMPMQPRFGQPDLDFPSGFGLPSQGYGYGPQGGDPYSYERGPAANWGGEQPMFPGGAQPWNNRDWGSFQGPPPPGADYTQP
jgi:hypothetical protein